MLTADFDFELPEKLIAQEAKERGTSRLLVLEPGAALSHRGIGNLPDLLAPGDLLVVNDTRVIPARLFATRAGTGGRVELLLAEKRNDRRWLALARPGRRLRAGALLRLDDHLEAQVTRKLDDGKIELVFSEAIEPHLGRLGHVPLPPYIQRPDTRADRERYQTIFATAEGAIAAPTAGLHFTPELIALLGERQVRIERLTLHVGIGTFKPVTALEVTGHRMEHERYEVPERTAAAIRTTRESGGRVVAVGTTVMRTLESVARVYGEIVAGGGVTDLFIYPGFQFSVADLLLTNFHLPRSTLLMLVCAFGGTERVLRAYSSAVENRYRFYSYGDAMLVNPP